MSYSLCGSHVEDEGSEIEGMEMNWKAFPVIEARDREDLSTGREKELDLRYI